METATIVLISVLSTLSVVFIIALVFISFYKLNKKIDELTDSFYRDINAIDNNNNSKVDALKREMDSRCDKLDSKIKLSKTDSNVSEPSNSKKILEG